MRFLDTRITVTHCTSTVRDLESTSKVAKSALNVLLETASAVEYTVEIPHRKMDDTGADIPKCMFYVRKARPLKSKVVLLFYGLTIQTQRRYSRSCQL